MMARIVPVPHLPRWQRYLLLLATVVAVSTCCCLRLEGHDQWTSLTPLVLPFMLWWPSPCTRDKRLQWWLLLLVLVGLVTQLLVAYLWPA